MSNVLVFRLSLKLATADIISEFIPLRPVIENREQLVSERLQVYSAMLSEHIEEWRKQGNVRNYNNEQLDELIEHAVSLVSADISSGFISHSPVLCDRDIMIIKSVEKYINLINMPVNEISPEVVAPLHPPIAKIIKPSGKNKMKNRKFKRKS